MNQYQGKCFCGSVQFQVSGAPEAMGYCHCDSCRRWSAGPVNAFSLWPADTLKILSGADQIGDFHLTEQSHRKWCKQCGGHIFTDHPAWGLVDVYVANLPQLAFEPAVNWQGHCASTQKVNLSAMPASDWALPACSRQANDALAYACAVHSCSLR